MSIRRKQKLFVSSTIAIWRGIVWVTSQSFCSRGTSPLPQAMPYGGELLLTRCCLIPSTCIWYYQLFYCFLSHEVFSVCIETLNSNIQLWLENANGIYRNRKTVLRIMRKYAHLHSIFGLRIAFLVP